MKEFPLKYGCNPNQKTARVYVENGDLPITILNGRPGYINLLDALNGWQLVKELKAATGIVAATSFKHTSPAGAAIGKQLNDVLRKIYFVGTTKELSPLACAYARARGADRMSSFGDFIALSDECDEDTATLIKKEVSDGVIAPSYSGKALEILKTKKNGNYCIIQIDKDYEPPLLETKTCFGIKFEQEHNFLKINKETLGKIVTKNTIMSDLDKENLVIALITLKYTQSNSVCFAMDGQAIGIGAGQQSRIHCTRLAAQKAATWHLRQMPQVLELPFRSDLKRADRDNAIDVYVNNYFDIVSNGNWERYFRVAPAILTQEQKDDYLNKITGVALGSDAFFPFGDNIECAYKAGVTVISEPGGSIRDDDVIATCDKYNIAMAFSGVRLFHH